MPKILGNGAKIIMHLATRWSNIIKLSTNNLEVARPDIESIKILEVISKVKLKENSGGLIT